MSSQRQLLIWGLAALGATGLLGSVLVWQHRYAQKRWSVFLVGNPHTGGQVFERKRCGHCHAVNGWGGRLAPDLGFQQPHRSNINQLVTAMWNCAPRMWERMRLEKMSYPALSQEDMTHLFAFLYTTRYVDEPGDEARGERLFETKSCTRCHALRGEGGKIGPDLSTVSGVDTPIVWAQAMWNHAPAMEAGMRQLGLAWPKFEGGEMNDLLAYIREVSKGPRRESALLPADPDRGWKVFQSKSCLECHSVKGHGGEVGPSLGPRPQFPPTLVQFAGLMWNHSPEMWRAMQAKGVPRPTLEGRDMADLIAFLYSLRYFEPGGSPQAGEQLFARRGCSHCHGQRAEGSSRGPALRRSGADFTSINLAAGLWVHGPKMYQRTQELHLPWPALVESDVGDLVAFLNTPKEERR
ncbi:MAG: c-type cytochrome [Acidobacteria bacterium]|nr:c-type cytochrome [Acidobacteriota bacterium]